MSDHHRRGARTAAAAAAALLALTACAGGGEWRPLPGPSATTSPAPPPGPGPGPDPEPPPPSTGPARPGALVITQAGLPGLQLNRQVLDISTSDLEAALDDGTLVLAGQTDTCGLAAHERLKIAAVTDGNLAVTAFIVERPDAATAEGIRLGSTTDDIVRAYGRNAVFARDVRSRSGGQLLWTTDLETPGEEPTASSLHYAFDTDPTGRVTGIRAGFWPHVAHAAYCADTARRSPQTGWPLT